MYLDANDSLNLRKNKVYEPVETALIKYLLKRTDVCLDIGAHIGYFTILMAKQFEFVYAFEPERTNLELLKKNIDLNNLDDKVKAYDTVITDYSDCWEPPIQDFYLCDTNSGMHRSYPSKWCNRHIKVEALAIDDMLFHKIDFIKMDIEGSEMAALRGMKKLLSNSHPTMIIEFHPESIEEYGANPKEEYDFLKSLGYSIRLIPKISIPISYEELEKETRNDP